ncbi:MAG: hypothetical protein WDN07_00170 [Actinomycetota bacterium]
MSQTPGEFEVGVLNIKTLPAVDPNEYVIGSNVPTVGGAAVTDKVIEVIPEPYPFAGAWYAVIMVVPTVNGVTVVPMTVATDGLEEVYAHKPALVDVGWY